MDLSSLAQNIPSQFQAPQPAMPPVASKPVVQQAQPTSTPTIPQTPVQQPVTQQSQPTQPGQLDQQVVALAKAIRYHETGNRPVAGQTGELPSRYQFEPATWRAGAKAYLGDENAPLTLENENKVAYSKIKAWKDSGLNPAQIASMWNSGNPNPYAKGVGGVGVSSSNPNVSFDVPKYVQSVYSLYKKYNDEAIPAANAATAPQKGDVPPEKPVMNAGQTWAANHPVITGIGQAMKGVGDTVAPAVNWGYNLLNAVPPVKVIADTIGGTAKALYNLPGQLASDVTGAASDIEKGGVGNVTKGIIKSLLRPAADVASAIYAPIGSAIGSIEKQTGIQSATEKVAQFIVDKSGITDQKWFQDYAVNHPNAEEDFNRAMMLAMSGKEAMSKEGSPDIGKSLEKAKQTLLQAKDVVQNSRNQINLDKSVDKVREAITPRQSDIKRAGGVDGFNGVVRTLVRDGIPIDKSGNNTIDMKGSVIPQLRANEDVVDGALQETLAQYRGQANINLEDARQTAFQRIEQGYNVSPTDIKARKAVVDNLINDTIEERTKQGKDPIHLDPEEAQVLKRRMNFAWDTEAATKAPAGRAVRWSLQTSIENFADQQGIDPGLKQQIQAMNARLGEYEQAVKVLEPMDGKVIKGGRLGQYFAKGAGEVVGGMAGSIMGPLGTIGGAITGEHVSGFINDMINNPETITQKAIDNARKAGEVPGYVKTAQDARNFVAKLKNLRNLKAQTELNQGLQGQTATPLLNAPSAMYMPEKTGSTLQEELNSTPKPSYPPNIEASQKAAGIYRPPEQNTENYINKLYSDAPQAKQEIDNIANDISSKFEGSKVATAPLKKIEKVRYNINNKYAGDLSRVSDIARNTIVAGDKTQLSSIVKELQNNPSHFSSKEISPSSDPLGYSGQNFKMQTSNGHIAEIQANSKEMIFAKEKPSDAIKILGENTYNELKNKFGDIGGKGHIYYDDWSKALFGQDIEKADKIASESKKYYSIFQ